MDALKGAQTHCNDPSALSLSAKPAYGSQWGKNKLDGSCESLTSLSCPGKDMGKRMLHLLEMMKKSLPLASPRTHPRALPILGLPRSPPGPLRLCLVVTVFILGRQRTAQLLAAPNCRIIKRALMNDWLCDNTKLSDLFHLMICVSRPKDSLAV